jgi:hypothetical protein
MNLPRSWRGLILVCLLASASLALETEVDDSNTESPINETESPNTEFPKTETETKTLLKGKNETDLLIEEHANSTELSRESRKIESVSSGTYNCKIIIFILNF